MYTTMQEFRVYLAEDDIDNWAEFKAALATVCPKSLLLHANNCYDLLRRLATRDPEVPTAIFLDLNPLKSDCAKMVRMIRKEPLNSGLPIVVLSSTSDHEFLEALYHAGATHFMQKTNNTIDLETGLQQVFNLLSKESMNATRRPAFQQFVVKQKHSDHEVLTISALA